jgi:hypothetical protein
MRALLDKTSVFAMGRAFASLWMTDGAVDTNLMAHRKEKFNFKFHCEIYPDA